MKKYITIAALLVAGTAFANADTITSVTIYNALNSILNPGTILVGGQSSITGGNQALTFNLDGVTTLTKYTLTFRVDSLTKADDSWLRFVDNYDGGIRTSREGELSLTSNLTTDISSPLSVNKTDIYSLTFDGTTAYLANLSTPVTTDYISVKPFEEGDNGSWSLVSGTARIWTNGGTNKITVGQVANLANYSSAQIREIALTGIPEPSAFGLLAGLGALALVGTRRRRK